MKKDNPVIAVLEVAGLIGTGLWLYHLVKPTAPALARLDDVNSPEPQPYVVAGEAWEWADPSTGLAGFLGDTDTDTVEALAVTDEPTAPLKLRRLDVVNVALGQTTDSLRAETGNTTRRAKRANSYMPQLARNVVNRYGATIRRAAALHNVPAAVIASKICIENPDLKASIVTGGGATGIMQITPGTAATAIRTEYRAGNLMPAEAAFFQQQLGAARWAALLAGRGSLTTADLQRPVLNIHVGTLAFGQIMRKYTSVTTGKCELYKAAAEYNRGGRAEYANARVNSPDALISFRSTTAPKYNTPAVTQQYIMLTCGPGGPLDYITRNNLI